MFEPISELAEINPPLRIPTPAHPDAFISFIPMSDVSESGQWLTHKARAFSQVKSGFTPFQEGDVLFAKITPCMENGKGAHAVGLEQGIGYGSTEFHVLRAKAENSPRYIFHLSQSASLRLKAEASMIGSAGQKRVPSNFFLKHQVFAPNSAEQRLIARILDTLDIQIQKTEALIAKLEKVKEGLLHDLLTRGIDENGRLRPSPEQAPELYKESSLGLIPREWNAGHLVDYVVQDSGIKPGPFGSSITKDSYAEKGFKVYGQEQVISEDQDSGDYFIPSEKFQELSEFSVRSGDVLISLVGTIGRSLLIKDGYEEGVINPRLMRIRPNKNIALPSFVSDLIKSKAFSMRLVALAGGGTMPVINKGAISRAAMPLVPLNEQREISRRIMTIRNRLYSESYLHSTLLAKKTGLMDDLLTGRVRVTPLLEQAQATSPA